MTYTYLRSPKARIAWLSITVGALLWMGTSVVLTLQGWDQPGVTARETTELARMIFGMILFTIVFGSPFFTSHSLDKNELIVRQGLNFTGVIPYENIASVQLTDRKPIGGLGLRVYPNTLFVIIWPDKLVSIKLKNPQRFRLFHILPLWKMKEVIVNVDDPSQFADSLRRRATSLL